MHPTEKRHTPNTLGVHTVWSSQAVGSSKRRGRVLGWPGCEIEQHREQGAELNDDRVEDSTASQASSACDERAAR